MKPGRELDALMAEALGFKTKWFVYPDNSRILLCLVGKTASRNDGWVERDDWRSVPPYSTEIAAAWRVDRPGWTWEFQETSHDLTATLYPSPEARMEAVTSYPVLPEGVALVRREWGEDKASTYAWVRCLAALRAVGVEVENG